MKLTLRIWRQKGPATAGKMETHELPDVSPDMSFLEMLDVLNEQLQNEGKEPVAFDHDCREGICGTCSLVINGVCTCGRSTTATPSTSSPSARRRSRW
jgi:succinate dehydrogenase / fumarate reductase iron-sulfur subunit